MPPGLGRLVAAKQTRTSLKLLTSLLNKNELEIQIENPTIILCVPRHNEANMAVKLAPLIISDVLIDT